MRGRTLTPFIPLSREGEGERKIVIGDTHMTPAGNLGSLPLPALENYASVEGDGEKEEVSMEHSLQPLAERIFRPVWTPIGGIKQ